MFSGSSASGATRRHATIYANFDSSFGLHKKAGRFVKSDPGHFHIGAFHGARFPFYGGGSTTTQLLIADGYDVGVVRLIVDQESRFEKDEEGIDTLIAGEYAQVEVIGTSTAFSLVPILRRASGGQPIGVAITGAAPFSRIRPEEASGSRGYNQYFDAIVFLP